MIPVGGVALRSHDISAVTTPTRGGSNDGEGERSSVKNSSTSLGELYALNPLGGRGEGREGEGREEREGEREGREGG